ncbi:MAG: histidinol dehydrogenase [Flavobacterium sp.]
MKTYLNPKPQQWSELTTRPTQDYAALEDTVQLIFKEVQAKGDVAVQKYTNLFDGVQLDNLKVSQIELTSSESLVSSALKSALQQAKENIETFHKAQQTPIVTVETSPGVICWQEKRPIEKVGLYIPGGTAPLFSTVLMLAIPAKLAGCKEIVLCSPPRKDGSLAPEILYAAQLCGVTEVYKVGGIQAIAALTFGTASIPKVSKIFGPGNQYVTVAKQVATRYGAAIDLPAGPSELLVYADETAVATFVASDLLSQAEHGADSQVVLVASNATIVNKVQKELEAQLNTLSRKSITEKAIQNSLMIVLEKEEEALAFINAYGPEHFIVCSKNEDFFINGIQNAGSVFVGNYTPESAGDYASGTNHTLPTNGYAQNYSGVNLDSFLKSMTFQKISSEGLQNLGNTIEVMAEAEGLDAHKNAVTIRLNTLK